ncbi:MAG: STAS domain-containing protein [Aeromicrobium sp.]|jgi:anti-sigma B factor antagonist|nr:STAS domain-containing protein [Aeromicrobium sp.]
MELDVTKEQSGTTCTVMLNGEVDVYTSPRLKQELGDLIDAGCVDLVVGLDGLSFIDSSGLGVLVSALRRAKEHGGTLRLVCTSEAILKIFRITGLDKVFPLFSEVEEARGF